MFAIAGKRAELNWLVKGTHGYPGVTQTNNLNFCFSYVKIVKS